MTKIEAGNLSKLDTPMTSEFFKTYQACPDGMKWVLDVLSKGETLRTLLPKFDRVDWMIWTLRRADALTKVQYVELAVICAQTVLGIYERKYPEDKRPRKAIEAAVAYAKNPCEKMRIAAAAYAAAYAAYAADAAAADAAADAAAADAAKWIKHADAVACAVFGY